jgi:dUTP pyrophosphatase
MKMLNNGRGILPPALAGDVGFDLICAEDTYLMVGRPTQIPVAARVKLPEGCWGLILPRSSAVKKGIAIIPSVIDNGYIGPLFTVAYAISGSLSVFAGERLAQMIIMPMIVPELDRTDETLPQTVRGAKGFGSTNEKHETA